ncbi:MAG: hypothetical protein ACYTGW_20135, partial [Planctomycetota bacterium]
MTRVSPLALLALPAPLTLLALLAGSAAALVAQSGVTLKDVPALAKARADRQRPALEKKLAPHWNDLGRDPVDDRKTVDNRIAEVVKLGHSVVPLLLEKLEPTNGGPRDRNLAQNCATILAQLDPKNFVEALIDIATGRSYTGQGHAIRLLGMTQSPQAGQVLTKLLKAPRLDRLRRRTLIRALTTLAHSPAAGRIASLLPCDNRQDHDVVVNYLMVVPAPAAVPHLLGGMARLRRASAIMDYVRILERVAVGDAKVAVALLPLLDGEKLDHMQVAKLCGMLGTIAPREHEPTIKTLRGLVETGRTGDLELEAAISLRRLGDKVGPKKLLANLKQKVRGRNKKDYLHHNNLGDYYLAFAEYQLAVRSYENAIKHASSISIQSRLYVNIARAEARRSRWAYVRRALRNSKANHQQLIKYGQEFPELQEAYKQETLRKFLDDLKPKNKANGKGNGKGNG